jgi:curli biogenesis system outer membrane secretion channel CsgG
MRRTRIGAVAVCAAALLLTIGCAGAPKASGGGGAGQVIPNVPVTTTGPKKRVAVVDFENKALYGKGRLGDTATDILVTELVKSDKFIVVERQKLETLLDEQKLQRESFMDPATAARTGRILGVNAIVTGAITQFGIKTEGTDVLGYKKKVQTAECVVDIRVVDVETGRVLYADSGKGVFQTEATEFMGMGQKAGYNEVIGGESLRAAISTFLNNVIAQIDYLEWTGKIAKVEGGLAYVNAGQKTGLPLGGLLVVRQKGEVIVDPDTKVAIGEAPGARRGTLKVLEYFGEDGSVCQVQEGTGFQVGDQVRVLQ